MVASNSPTLLSDEKRVSIAGTPVALPVERVLAITIIAKAKNKGNVYVGGANVSNQANDGLAPSEGLAWHPSIGFDLNSIFIDADSSGDGVDFYGLMA